MVDFGSSSLHPTTTITTSPLRHLANHGDHVRAVPLPSSEGCGPVKVALDGGKRGEREEQGGGKWGPMRWEAHAVRHKNGPSRSPTDHPSSQ